MDKFSFNTFLSPLSWRYGSEEMRRIFSEKNKYLLWRRIWVALAEAQYKAGIVSQKELEDLEKHEGDIDINRILEIEKETKHDVVAAIKEFAEKAKVGGGKIHLGATSMDIVDNADVIRLKDALEMIEVKVSKLLKLFCQKIEKYASYPCIGFTHLQPAEPTTVGYRLSFYAQDLLTDFDFLKFVKDNLYAKGMKGAVGTSASYKLLVKSNKAVEKLEKQVMQSLGIKASLISSQVYSRKVDFLVLSLLQSIASSISKFAGDLRLLQSASIFEWSEPFGKKQVGSSAMPFKKNPISSENICSLARFISKLPSIAIENASHSYLERTLDDSANRRLIIPEGFLALDQILETCHKILSGLVINKERIDYNLAQFGPFAATEVILMEVVKNGADRQEMHEVLREISLEAWNQIQKGKENPMKKLLTENKYMNKYLPKNKIIKLLDVSTHIGDAPKRSLLLLNKIYRIIKK